MIGVFAGDPGHLARMWPNVRATGYGMSMRFRFIRFLALPALVLGSGGAQAARGPETAVESLHRQGVHCMEVLERRQCAIDSFEAVLEERTTQRELVSDSMLRLIELYDREGRTEELKQVMRRFWDVGMKRRSLGHIAYSARFFPAELDVLVDVDMQRLAAAPIVQQVEYGAEYVFTCSEARRADIRMLWRWKRARAKSAIDGREPHEHIYEEMDRERERRQKYERKRSERDGRSERHDSDAPLFAEVACPVAEALGDESLLDWRGMTGMMSHQDFTRSMGVAQVPDLDAKLTQAEGQGRLERIGSDRWVLPGFEYAGQAVHLAKLDHDELMAARADMIAPVIAARQKRKERMHRDIVKLVTQTPPDAGAFVVLTSAAVQGLGASGMRDSTAGFLQALLPKPKGLQAAAVFQQHFGLFTRMPTDNAVKGKMLVGLAQKLVGRAEADDPQTAEFLRNLDIAEAEDRRALLLAYVMTSAQVEKMMLQ